MMERQNMHGKEGSRPRRGCFDEQHSDGESATMDHKLNLADRAEPAWSHEAALRLVRLPALMDITVGVPDITVALIDGPIAVDHPGLAVERIRALNQRKGVRCVKPEGFACTHGTFVAGLSIPG
jgi:hypothetical protein